MWLMFIFFFTYIQDKSSYYQVVQHLTICAPRYTAVHNKIRILHTYANNNFLLFTHPLLRVSDWNISKFSETHRGLCWRWSDTLWHQRFHLSDMWKVLQTFGNFSLTDNKTCWVSLKISRTKINYPHVNLILR